jgi:TolB-like protein/class 3 adenylate cyclase/Tfp pilus assembly protein PilF
MVCRKIGPVRKKCLVNKPSYLQTFNTFYSWPVLKRVGIYYLVLQNDPRMIQSRQLAAIMFADIVGYTAIMQEDESQASLFRNKLQQKLQQEVTDHEGVILQFMGDGALCKFSSSTEAVKAALAVQLDMLQPPVVPLRIGLHTGDVILEGGNAYGDGVNIASRLESFAVPGSIFISGKVHDDIKNQRELETISLGEFRLKNVNKPVEIFAVSNTGIKIPNASSLEGKGEKLKQQSMLVLPFVNMSNDPEQEFFSDGLTEELIAALSKLQNIRIISRTTSMKYKETTKDLKTIGLETGADFIMEGSVRKQGSNLRITAQFVDALRDVHIWSESYRGTIDDIFDIQQMVSCKIMDALKIQLTLAEQELLKKRYTDNSEAYQLYLQGRHSWRKRNDEGLQNAIVFFEKALQKDEDYALAWAGIADTYSLMGEYSNVSRREYLPKQMAAIHRALELDNRLGEAHISLAISLMLNDWDWKNSQKEYKTGLELSPNYATGHHWYAEWLLFTGNIEEAYKEISQAVDLDPGSQGILKDKGIFYYYSRQYEKAIDMALMTLELHPGFFIAHRLLSLAYERIKDYPAAIEHNQIWGEGTGNKWKTAIALAQIQAAAGQEAEAKKILDRINPGEFEGGNDYRGVALVYTALGEIENAFEWLDKSYRMHEESLCSIKVDPKLDPLRSDPRFTGLLQKLGLASNYPI